MSKGRSTAILKGLVDALPPSRELTLRDRFAMAALTGLLARPEASKWSEVDVAYFAYTYADAMIARGRRP